MRGKSWPRLPALLLILACGPLFEAAPLELGGTFLLENMRFDPNRPSSDLTFSGRDLFWGGVLYGRQPVSETLSVEFSVSRDTVLRTTAHALLRFREGIVALSAGPCFGLFNSSALPVKPGVSTAAELTFPGVAILQARVDSPLVWNRGETGAYTQELYEASLGFYVPNAILSLGYLQKRFILRTAAGETVDGLTVCSLSTDIYQKNVPYRVNLELALETLSRIFDESGTESEHALSSLVLGTQVSWTVRDFLSLQVDLRSSIYSFGRHELLGITNPGPGGFLFRLYTGAALDLGRLSTRR